MSCKKESAAPGSPTPVSPITADSSIAPASFNFNTTRTVSISVSFAANNNDPIAGIPVSVYSTNPNTPGALLTAMTDANGQLNAEVNLPAYIDTLVIDANYIGLMRNAIAVIDNNAINGKIGGPTGFSGNISANNFAAVSKANGLQYFMHPLNSTFSLSAVGTTYTPMGPWDSAGVPQYLEPVPDVISAQLLSFLNTSLPERVDVRTLHPQYLASTATADLVITQTADVWVTFVSEGAGYLNTVGYYSYPTATPPQSAADIKNVYYVFPNASLPGSGGGLQPGSKVKLGTFNAGTSIGFVLLSNAYNYGAQTVSTNGLKFYTTTACNPETNPALKRHTVLLAAPQNRFCIGFEDMDRENPSCDNDFNDVIIYGSSNPVSAISTNGVAPIDQPIDSDGDGVPDNLDAFPNDPARAYISYYPSKSTFGTIAFEDLWPATGDYDMNDLVVGYRYKIVSNAKNQIVEVYGDYAVNAAGASYISGFGVQFPFSPSQVATVTGQKFAGNYVKQNGNGTEAGQSKAVIIPFDNYQALVKRPDPYYVNTQIGAPYQKSDTAHVYMSFTTPLSPSTFGTAPFNPFLISNQRRGYEVHLPNMMPTDLADKTLFGTLQDRTNLATGFTYKTKNGWPWALNFAGPFNYPTEGTNISKAYNYFLQWALSGGTQHTDWYINQNGNVNTSLIYTH
jgi:LruC domain-containing protein